jgi:hypothetical protein
MLLMMSLLMCWHPYLGDISLLHAFLLFSLSRLLLHSLLLLVYLPSMAASYCQLLLAALLLLAFLLFQMSLLLLASLMRSLDLIPLFSL